MKANLLLLFCFLATNSFAQQVSNVFAKQEGKQVVISYDITGSKTTDKFEVKLFYAQGSNEWREAAKGLSGDIGSNITGGTGKEIRWKPLDEFSKLTGSSYHFKVVVSYKSADPYGIGDNMVYIEGGTFTMGCTAEQGSDCNYDEKPSHSVTLKSFYLNKYEVTQAQWRLVMGSNPSAYKGCDNCPVERVSWDEIQEFINKLNSQTGGRYRLPTEAEWEYAARGGNKSKGYKYSGSNDVTSVAWYTSNSDSKTHVVGQKQANELGLYDMSGNVWEWCSDWYSENYYYSSPSQNPAGSGSGTYRVVRGGSWYSGNLICRVAYRKISLPYFNYSYYGFRLAQDL
jgi:formylglycine-generating enzyme required for sulfatase activity